jgi:beta-lactamase superfamily II metal-dependent hydrolase
MTIELPKQGFVFWNVGTGDSTTIAITDGVVMQVDLRHMVKAENDDDPCCAIVDVLAEKLPTKNGKPYLSVFALTHPDLDHIQGFEDLLSRVVIGELWFTPRVFRE